MPTTTALHITSLDRELRKDLERTIGKARMAAEAGAERALQGLGVHLGAAPAHLDKAGRDLRNALRAHGRQAGDVRDERTREQGTGHLVQEVAYAHWHRMLFARFLAENDLLISYEYGVVVDLANAAERAEALGMRDVWEYAAKCAQPMLPQIFPAEDPVLQLALPPETVSALTELLNALPPAVFQATDSLGWVYQFWQTERKKEVNDRTRAGQKVEADDISPVTQLFTEDYMVLFLLHNTLGAWWAGKRMQEPVVRKQLEACASEADCRAVVALPGVDWEYLRWRKLDDGSWTPAAGTFEKWPRQVKELKVLDPCMGSGHFLVFALPMLVAMRMAEEGLGAEDAVAAVLRDNLYGLELDPRCTQIAAFNLALAAWKLAGHQALPPLHLACSGMAPNSSREEWAAIAELAAAELSTDEQARMKAGMERLYDLFAQAPTLGSLIDPNRIAWDAFTMSPAQVLPLLEKALCIQDDVEVHERAAAAQGLAKAAELLAGQYTLVATNVPYLGRKHHSDILKRYADDTDIEARSDLANLFTGRCLQFCNAHGTAAEVTPNNWLFLTSYKKHRVRLLKERTWNFIGRLGPRGFQTPMWDFNIGLIAISAGRPGAQHQMAGVDATYAPKPFQKALVLRGEQLEATMEAVETDPPEPDSGGDEEGDALETLDAPPGSLHTIVQAEQLQNADARVSFAKKAPHPLLGTVAETGTGLQTFDRSRFIFAFTEIAEQGRRWELLQTTPTGKAPYTGCDEVLRWEEGAGDLADLMKLKAAEGYTSGIWRAGSQFWGRVGVLHGVMSNLPYALYAGGPYDTNCAVIIPKDEKDLPALLCFSKSGEFSGEVRKIDSKLMVTNATFVKVPCEIERLRIEASHVYSDGVPEPESDDPTQWLFHGHPVLAEGGTQLQVAVARLLGYRWPPEHDAQMRLSAGARALVQESEKLLPFADPDGIVCLSAVHGEAPAYKRLQALLREAYGGEWDPAQERKLLEAAGHAEESLESWLRDSFFKEHCKLFHDRPFVWHVWDGRQDGFHALVNYHQLAAPNGGGRRTLEKLIYTYLGEWITRQEQAVEAGADGAEARRAAALKLKGELEKILNGEAPYDLFVRWKPLHQQAIGWEPDINDGVRLNIRPWLLAADVKAKGAGLLRHKPNIKWGKDRGKEPQREPSEHPWFWSWDERTVDFTGGNAFDGARWNDLHYTLEAKRAARRQHEQP